MLEFYTSIIWGLPLAHNVNIAPSFTQDGRLSELQTTLDISSWVDRRATDRVVSICWSSVCDYHFGHRAASASLIASDCRDVCGCVCALQFCCRSARCSQTRTPMTHSCRRSRACTRRTRTGTTSWPRTGHTSTLCSRAAAAAGWSPPRPADPSISSCHFFKTV